MTRVPTAALELAAYRQSRALTAGVDEVGRGPVAGPIVASAVILPVDPLPAWGHLVRDSKQLTPERREWLARIIVAESLAVGIAAVSSREIDRLGIAAAGFVAMRQAVAALSIAPGNVLVDAFRVPDLDLPQLAVVRGDSRCVSIAAASIVAKVVRDRAMAELDAICPGYGFAQHKGYGTRQHLAAVRRAGLTVFHRVSFLGALGLGGDGPLDGG